MGRYKIVVKQTALKDLKQIQKSGDKATTIKRVEKKLKFLITLKASHSMPPAGSGGCTLCGLSVVGRCIPGN